MSTFNGVVFLNAFDALAAAFAMASLAMLAAKPRESIEACMKEIKGTSIEPMDVETAAKLHTKVIDGSVTCIVKTPQPYLFIFIEGTFGKLMVPYGVWIGRRASFYGKPQKELPRLGIKTAEEAGFGDLTLPVEG